MDRPVTRGFPDYFSTVARDYARYRPRYPDALYDYLASIAPARDLAWDCGTGNGQVAVGLAGRFRRVVATDASGEQIAHAEAHERVDYRVARVEDVRLEPGSVDLVTAGTAVHWFDLDAFYGAALGALVPRGVLAVWTYHLPETEPAVDRVVERYYRDVLAGHWPEQIRYLDERYETLPFPLEPLGSPQFTMEADWDLGQLLGFLESWSGARNYEQALGRHPAGIIWPDLAAAWGEPGRRRRIRWPLHMKVGLVT